MYEICVMQILLVAATIPEIEPFLNKRPDVDHLITGVGSPETIYHLTKRLLQIDYDLVIQAGIAGSFNQSYQLGEVVLVEQDNFADVGIFEKGHFSTIFEAGFGNEDLFPFTKGWLNGDKIFLDQFHYSRVKAVTVNTITDNELQVKQLVSKFDPQIETMEGAALHYVCLQEKVSFMQIRSISNYVGERNKEKWKLSDAINNLNEELIKIADKLTGIQLINKQINR